MIFLEDLSPEQRAKYLEEKGKESADLSSIRAKARYRCSQTNIVQAGDLILFSSEIKTEYLLSASASDPNLFHVRLVDYVYATDPKSVEDSFQVVVPIEYIRNNILFTLNSDGAIIDINNIEDIKSEWDKFKTKDLPKIDFYKKVIKQNISVASDMEKTGDLEYSNVSNLSKILDQNLFHHIFTRSHAGENVKNYNLNYQSTLFPGQKINIEVAVDTFRNGKAANYRLSGTLDKKNISTDKLKEEYDKLYKPLLKYNYTEFDFVYDIDYCIDNNEKILDTARATLEEKIKNNYESKTLFTIKKVEL